MNFSVISPGFILNEIISVLIKVYHRIFGLIVVFVYCVITTYRYTFTAAYTMQCKPCMGMMVSAGPGSWPLTH